MCRGACPIMTYLLDLELMRTTETIMMALTFIKSLL